MASVNDQRFPSIVEAVSHQWIFCNRSEISQHGGYQPSVGGLLLKLQISQLMEAINQSSGGILGCPCMKAIVHQLVFCDR